MTQHNYKCWDCGYHFLDKVVNAPDCPKCKSTKTGVDSHVAIHGNYKTPIHSDSLAINPSQIAEHKKMFPNIELDGDCRPIFDNFVDHRNYLKATGFVKAPKKTKVLGRKKLVIK